MVEGLKMNFAGECSEVGMYLAMARRPTARGYPRFEAFKRYAYEEADHASRFAEMLGEVLTDSTKKNLEMRVEAEWGANKGKKDLATLAKELGYDAVHDTVHEMCKDEARHGKGFEGLLKRYFAVATLAAFNTQGGGFARSRPSFTFSALIANWALCIPAPCRRMS